MWRRLQMFLMVGFWVAGSAQVFANDARRQGPSQATEKKSIAAAEKAFENGLYLQASKTSQALLIDEPQMTKSEKCRLYHLLALLDLAHARAVEMNGWLRKLHDVDPGFAMNPVKDPPALIESWHKILAEAKQNEAQRHTATENADTAEEQTEQDVYKSPLGKVWSSVRDNDRAVVEESRFWVSLVPFGIGHFEAGRYWEGIFYLSSHVGVIGLTSELDRREESHGLDTSLANAGGQGKQSSGSNYHASAVGMCGFLGAWGHELASLDPQLRARDPEKAQVVRYLLSFAPFGVGQRKNGETSKALGFGVAQGILMTASFSAATDGQRALFYSGFLLAWAYGAYDGWARHVWADDKKSGRAWDLQFAPMVDSRMGGHQGLAMAAEVSYRF